MKTIFMNLTVFALLTLVCVACSEEEKFPEEKEKEKEEVTNDKKEEPKKPTTLLFYSSQYVDIYLYEYISDYPGWATGAHGEYLCSTAIPNNKLGMACAHGTVGEVFESVPKTSGSLFYIALSGLKSLSSYRGYGYYYRTGCVTLKEGEKNVVSL